VRLENGRIIPGEPPAFKQKTQCLDASTGGHLKMERASVDQLLTVMAPFTLGQETKRFTPSRPTSKVPLKARGQYAVRTSNAPAVFQRTSSANTEASMVTNWKLKAN